MKFSVLGAVVFVVLVAGFFWWFGGPGGLSDNPEFSMPAATRRAWFYCSLCFVGSAGTACFGDKQYGLFPPASLRWLFILGGIVGMAIGVLWMHGLSIVFDRQF